VHQKASPAGLSLLKRHSTLPCSHLSAPAGGSDGVGTLACLALHAWLPRFHRADPSTSLDEISLIGWYSIGGHVTIAADRCQTERTPATLKFWDFRHCGGPAPATEHGFGFLSCAVLVYASLIPRLGVGRDSALARRRSRDHRESRHLEM